ncbi:AraC family transcriptional regulator [Jidongwangia harbinensis]|uniref:AraC family transcriptional regulator n=1 Tax=Jidongwangia harbinensis TaxID=2878561 RepID=UPI001CD92515|nr:AraC family transcriptional regulator [Jidongwangia harbinensis]MCA2219531.1 AraC family transcriptional regulator [Jidongwangia harbinensis]
MAPDDSIGPYAIAVETTDLDEARAVCGEQLYPRTLRLIEPSRGLAARFAFLHMGMLTLADVRYGAEIAGGTRDLGSYHVNLPLAGRFAARQGRRAITGDAGRAGVYRPVGATTLVRASADCHLLALKIDCPALETQLAALLGADVRGPIRLDGCLDPRRNPGRLCADLIRLLGDEIHNPTGLAYQPIMAAPLQESLMTALLYAVGHQYQDALRSTESRAGPRQVTRAIDAVQDFPERPHTATGLAELAGVSVRSLRGEFHRRVGRGPMAYLRDVRMARVHAELTAADPARTTVAAVARRWGFARMGVFTAYYLARYHTTPAQTLLDGSVGGGL